jgi:hypothetical protein
MLIATPFLKLIDKGNMSQLKKTRISCEEDTRLIVISS